MLLLVKLKGFRRGGTRHDMAAAYVRWLDRVPVKAQIRFFAGKTLKLRTGGDGFDLISAETFIRRVPVDAIGKGVFVVNDYIRV